MQNKYIAVEFLIDDVVYITFSPKEILKGKVTGVEIKKDRIAYSTPGTSTFSNYLDCAVKNVYGDLSEAIDVCIKWGKEEGQTVLSEEIKIIEMK